MVPLIACDDDALIDVVPQDVVAAAAGRADPRRCHRRRVLADRRRRGADRRRPGRRCTAARAPSRARPTAPRFIPAEAVDRLLLPLLPRSPHAMPASCARCSTELLEMTWLFQAPGRASDVDWPSPRPRRPRSPGRAARRLRPDHRILGQRKGLLPRPADGCRVKARHHDHHVPAHRHRHAPGPAALGDATVSTGTSVGGRAPSRAQLPSAAWSRSPVKSGGAGSSSHDGRRYLDFGGYGVFILGHRHPVVVAAVHAQLDRTRWPPARSSSP